MTYKETLSSLNHENSEIGIRNGFRQQSQNRRRCSGNQNRGVRILERQHYQEAADVQIQKVYTRTDILSERTRNESGQRILHMSGSLDVGSGGHTQNIVEDLPSDKVPSTENEEGCTEPEVQIKRTAVRSSLFLSPGTADKQGRESINRISKTLDEMKRELRRVYEKADIPLKKSSAKKSVSQKCKKSVYVVTLRDENEGLCLEPMAATKVKHRKDKQLVNNLKFSLRKAKQWSIIHKGDHFKEMKKRKRARERKIKSAVIKSLKKNWNNTKITENRLDHDGKKTSVHYSKLKDIIRKWHIQPDTLSIHVYPVSRSLDPYFQSLENGDTNANETHMQIEWLRLNSFANSSRSIQVSSLFLARAGFYHTGREDEVQCYSCGLKYRNWRFGDDPCRIHRSLSPNCRHMTGNDRTNIPIKREEDDETPNSQRIPTEERAEIRNVRPDSYPQPENPSLPGQESAVSRANTGSIAASVQQNGSQSTENMFVDQRRVLPNIRSPNIDNIQAQTGRQTSNRQLPDNQQGSLQNISTTNNVPHNHPSTTHNQNHRADNTTNSTGSRPYLQTALVQNGVPGIMRGASVRPNQSSTNGMVNETNRQNIQTQRLQQGSSTDVSAATVRKLAPLGVNFDKPKYPAFAVLPVRISSYNGWSASQTPKLMAEAGFVYAGYADYSRCFFCGGGLRNWEDGDDPWVEHARWFPRCTYLRQNKGDGFIQLVHEDLNREDGNPPKTEGRTAPRDQSQSKEMEEMHSLPAYQSLVENGYNPKMIDKAMWNLHKRGQQIIDAVTIVGEIHRMEDTSGQCTDDVTNVMDDDMNHETCTPKADETVDQEMRELHALMEENRKLKREKTCRICEEEDASVAFLPCAHLVCCQICSQAVRRCPVCGQIIQGTVKTWMG